MALPQAAQTSSTLFKAVLNSVTHFVLLCCYSFFNDSGICLPELPVFDVTF